MRLCLSIAGPGATHLLTGLWDAHVDRAPILALVGQVDTQVQGAGAFPGVGDQARQPELRMVRRGLRRQGMRVEETDELMAASRTRYRTLP